MQARNKHEVSTPPPSATGPGKATSQTATLDTARASPLSLVRFRAAAAAVGVSEEELRRRVLDAGVKVHQVVRGGELTAAVDLDDVWRLYSSAAAPVDAALPAAVEGQLSPMASLSARLERELEDERALRAQTREAARSAQAAAESALFERTRAEQERDQARAATESVRAELVQKERALQADLAHKEGALRAELAQKDRALQAASEAARVEAERAQGELAILRGQRDVSRTAAEKLRDELRQTAQTLEDRTRELEASRGAARQGEQDLAAARELETNVRREQEAARAQVQQATDAQAARTKEAEAAKADQARMAIDLRNLEAERKREREHLAAAEKALSDERAERKRIVQEAARASELERQLVETKHALGQAETRIEAEARARKQAETMRQAVERELAAEREEFDAAKQAVEGERASRSALSGELEKLEESLAVTTVERERMRARIAALELDLATVQESERAIQRYADRKERELRELRADHKPGADAARTKGVAKD